MTNILNFIKELNCSKCIYCIYHIIDYTCHSRIRWKKYFKVKIIKILLAIKERLNGLVILSIGQDLLENIEYKSLISNFVA